VEGPKESKVRKEGSGQGSENRGSSHPWWRDPTGLVGMYLPSCAVLRFLWGFKQPSSCPPLLTFVFSPAVLISNVAGSGDIAQAMVKVTSLPPPPTGSP